jgi:hypothetical protein
MSGMARRLAVAALAASLTAAMAASRPASYVESWLREATTATAPGVAEPAGGNPFGTRDRFDRKDAPPGVVILSDGRTLAGRVYTTRDKDLEVWVESEKRWRHVPLILLLSIRAVVVEEGMEKEWRWKEMGSDEKTFTGREKPIRRYRWRLHLIDDSYVTGAVKGQPLWVDSPEKRRGPFILHERSAGKYGQTLKDLVHVKRVVISLRAMEEVIKARGASP